MIFSVAALVAALYVSPISRECLACHDGTVAVDIVLDQSHPVSVPVRDPGRLPLYDGLMECKTCHGVNVETLHWGERLSGDALCRECHLLKMAL